MYIVFVCLCTYHKSAQLTRIAGVFGVFVVGHFITATFDIFFGGHLVERRGNKIKHI